MKHRTEDPHRIAEFAEALASLDWAQSAFRASCDVVFQRISALAQAEIQYYYDRRRGARRLSKTCRLLVWGASAVGVLVPLIQPVVGDGLETFLSWGYLAFGLAGVVLIFENVFAVTHAHQRFSSSQYAVEKAYTIFALEWQALLLGLEAEPTPVSVQKLIDRSVAFATELHGVLDSETSLWKQAIDKGLADLAARVNAGAGKRG